ncbi:MAG: glycoside hydrolase family 2 [Armatimonadota bacterium]|nr:glycoside hydrolase family 2 [bacterium]
MDFRKGQPAIDLSGKWSFAYSEGNETRPFASAAELESAGYKTYPCSVPGNLELDLHANGIVGDPFYGMNIAHLARFEKSHVWYATRFKGADRPGFDAELVFHGLDCFADIYLNGKLIGGTDNMLIEHIFDVNNLLKEDNELLVHIRPAVEEAKKFDYPPYVAALGDFAEALYVRKAPHMYGWDIMPRAVSAGIWRPAEIRFRPKERLESAFLETANIAPDHSSAFMRLHYVTKISDGPDDIYEVEVEGVCGDSKFSSRKPTGVIGGRIQISLSNPKLWWPRGRGEQNLYDVTVRLYKNGKQIDSLTFTHGIKKVELSRTSLTDQYGNGEFCFKINGEKLFVLGTNWVPADAYHSRDVERIPQILDMVEDIGCNMIRCWGGNVYENDLFFEICDRKGILIWQDFAMACRIPPQDLDHQRVIEREARAVVRRLRQHACLALWAGDNEIDAALAGNEHRDPNKNVLTRKVLPAVLSDEDWTIPYIPSSPYIDEEAFEAGWEFVPENHPWGPRDYYKGDYYKNVVCHFASEIGYHGCPSPESIRKFISPEKVWPYKNNDEWTLHCTDPVPGVNNFGYRVELMEKQVRELFGVVPDNLDDYSLASQVSQAEAKKFFVEMFRTGKWRKTGLIWWNIMDGWPQFSDAVVGYYFDKKLAYDYIKRSQRPLLIALREPQSWRQDVVACNDTRNDMEMEFTLRDIDSGEVLLQGNTTAKADAVTPLGSIPFSNSKQRFIQIEWTDSLGRATNHYLAGYPPFDLNTYKGWLKKSQG